MSSTSRATADGRNTSTSSSKRRQRVDSNPLAPPAGPDPKRVRSGEAPAMSAKVQSKRPQVVGLASSPSAFQPHVGAKRLVIKNLRSAHRAAEVEVYYDRTWADIDAAFSSVFAGRLPRQPLERLHRGAEDICRNNQAERLFQMLKAKCENHLFCDVFGRITADARGASDIDVLRIVHEQWLTWSKQTLLIRSTFSYLDRAYLLNHRDHPQINDLAISLFRKMIFSGPGDRATGSEAQQPQPPPPGGAVLAGMCELVDLDRRGEEGFDSGLLRAAVLMLYVLACYGKRFEPLFLAQSADYFREFADERSTTSSLKQYIDAVQGLLRSEGYRCMAYNFDSTTKRQLLDNAHATLIEGYAEKLLNKDSVAKLLEDNEVESVRGLYELLRLSGIQNKLKGPWQAYIESTGTAIVTDVARVDDMVIRLLELRRKLSVMVRDAFDKHEDFTYTMRESFGHFINDKRIVSSWKTGTSKVGEMVAKYIDMLLRGGLKTLPQSLLSDQKDRAAAERSGQSSTGDEDAELDRQLEQALELFRFIDGKDVFNAFYKKDLARRLLMGRSASQDAERNMLGKLKSECGTSFTHSLEQMFKDQELAREEMASFNQWKDGRGTFDYTNRKVDLQVSVLSAAAWPSYPDIRLHLPAEVMEHVQQFDRYYKGKHTGRRLSWQHNLAHCVIKANFDRGPKELLISAFQACVLLLFNEAGDGRLSYDEIAQATGLPTDELERTLQSLACGKTRILTKEPKGKDVRKTDTFLVNKSFTDAKYRVKVNQIQLKETVEENQETHERIAEDRQYETQAAIVRIMKSRKTLPHAQLVAEVISQTKNRGAMDPAAIKQNIEKSVSPLPPAPQLSILDFWLTPATTGLLRRTTLTERATRMCTWPKGGEIERIAI